MNPKANLPFASSQAIIPTSEMRITTLNPEGKDFPASLEDCRGYEIIYIARGAGDYFIDLSHGKIGDNQVFVIRPDQKRRMVFDRCEEGYLFSFSAVFFGIGEARLDMSGNTQLLKAFSDLGQIILSEEMLGDLRDVANKLLKESSLHYPFQEELLTRYLKIFLLYLARHVNERARPIQKNRELDLVQQFLESLNQYYREKKMVVEYASGLFISANYLNEIVKKNTGYTASFHIRQRVVLEAKRMALFSDTSLKQIAYALGYTDPCQFSKFFQNVTGTNFSTFKKENKIVLYNNI